MNELLAPGERKRKALIDLPTRSKKARTQAEDSDFSAQSEDDSDGFDDPAKVIESGATTPASGKTPKTNPNWPSVQKTIQCPFPDCDRVFNRQGKLDDHVRSHNNERPFACTEDGCDKTFSRKTHLNRHIKSAHTEERNYVCIIEGCGKAFSTGTRLRRHEAQHVVRAEHQCGICGKEFRKQATMQRHVDSEHKGRKPFTCQQVLDDDSVCGAGFEKAAALKTHQSRAHGGKRYWCDICAMDSEVASHGELSGKEVIVDQFGFATYSEYQLHLREVHPPTCDICAEVCETNKQLTRHKELEHGIISNEQKPTFTCPEPGCGRSFSKKGNMDVHVRSVHAKQRPFVCGQIEMSALNHIEGWDGLDACGKDFMAKSQLDEHIRTAHLGLQNRQKTRQQAKASKSKAAQGGSNGKNALALLTGTAQIGCPITGCQATFMEEYDCEVHLQMVHGLDVSDEFEQQVIEDNAAPAADELDFDLVREIESNAQQGGSFWLGGGIAEVQGNGQTNDERDGFENTQKEMSRVVGDGHGWEDNIIVDPALLQD